jgi:6,7-dimethyl-8-ribityllumazine synthase
VSRPADDVQLPVAEPAAEPAAPAAEPAVVPTLRPPGGSVDGRPAEHAAGQLRIPGGYSVIEGEASGSGLNVGVVVSRFNGEITTLMLERAIEALEAKGVAKEAITVAPVPGAFELPLAAMALAKTRRYACVVALGVVIRGETAHFDYVAGEAASGIQLAALETGVPVAFGVLTCDTAEQALARVERAGDAARSALEMADVFTRIRANGAQATAR